MIQPQATREIRMTHKSRKIKAVRIERHCQLARVERIAPINPRRRPVRFPKRHANPDPVRIPLMQQLQKRKIHRIHARKRFQKRFLRNRPLKTTALHAHRMPLLIPPNLNIVQNQRIHLISARLITAHFKRRQKQAVAILNTRKFQVETRICYTRPYRIPAKNHIAICARQHLERLRPHSKARIALRKIDRHMA